MRTGKKTKNAGKPRFGKVVGDPRDARGLYCAMLRFLEHRGVTGATSASLFNLERSIRDFIGWADTRSVTHPEHVSMAVLERYQRHLYYYRKQDGAPLSVASQRAKLGPLKSWFKWLTKSGHLQANPAAELELPKRIKSLPRQVMSQAEAEQVLASVDTGSAIGLRDRAMMEVLYATGMRRMELANLQLADIDVSRALVFVRQGKGNKDRLIPLGARALHWVQQYLDRSRPQIMWNAQEMTLFLGIEGLPLSLLYLSSHISNHIKRADIGKTGSCHMFRHTMATLMLENGADIRFIQAMLGHARLDTTQIYTHLAIGQLMLVHANTHPGAALRVAGAGKGEETAKAAQEAPGCAQAQEERESALQRLYAALDQEFNEEGEAI
jgi:integrase/recombinase XerD